MRPVNLSSGMMSLLCCCSLTFAERCSNDGSFSCLTSSCVEAVDVNRRNQLVH